MDLYGYQVIRSPDLTHHGIKGQKWGTRNGPPYPLESGAHTAVEKTGIGRSYIEKNFGKCQNKKLVGMDPVTAYLITYTALIATAVAVNEIMYSTDKKNNVNSNTSDIQKKISGKHSAAQDLKAVNPDFADQTDMGARVNCTMCSAAYELRRRGYDVVAQKTTMGRKPVDAAKWFGMTNKDLQTYKTRDQFSSALEKEPDGARGLTFTSYGMFNTHHCMIWEKKNGQIFISDGQCNAAPTSIKESGISANGSHPYRYIRTDNANIDWDLIRDAVKERK